VYLTDEKTLWVLKFHPATDVEMEREYQHYIDYNR